MTQSVAPASFDRCVLPLFVPDGNRPKRLGCCVLVQLFGVHFVVTAEHVLRGTSDQPLFAGRAGHNLIPMIGFTGYFPTSRGAEHLDIAVMPLTESDLARFGGLWFVPEVAVEDDIGPHAPNSVHDYIVYGYPESNSQVRVERQRRNVKQFSFTVHTTLAKADISFREGIDPEAHLALEFDRENVTVRGRRHTAPSPHGISGGAVFHDVDGVLKLAGIMTEYRKNSRVLVATRMTEVIAFAEYVIRSEGLATAAQ
jgi:hypothetical protein